MNLMATDAFLSTFIQVNKFQNSHPNARIEVNMVRAEARTFLAQIQPQTYDFIYIDGDHKYEAVKGDIVQAKRVIKKDRAVLCGDDLERLPTDELVTLAQAHKDQDYLRGNHQFHPGVLLAVAEEFGHVNMHHGFWWVYVEGGEFTLGLE
jgi:hypothetical protein